MVHRDAADIAKVDRLAAFRVRPRDVPQPTPPFAPQDGLKPLCREGSEHRLMVLSLPTQKREASPQNAFARLPERTPQVLLPQ